MSAADMLPPEKPPALDVPDSGPRFWRRAVRVERPPLLSRLAIAAIVGVLLIGGAVGYLVLTTPADRAPPSQVTGLQVVDHFDGALEIVWSPATDDRSIVAYRVYRDDRLIAQVPSPMRSYVDRELPIDILFEYRASAVDGAGNEGPRSVPVRADSAPAPPDVTFANWAPAGPSDWRLPVADVSRSIDLRRFQATVVAKGSAIVVPPTSLEDLPAAHENVTLALVDVGGDGRLDRGDAFLLGGLQPGVRYTLTLLYIPASRILASSTLEP